MDYSLKLVLAQLNLLVGDIRGNTECILENIKKARELGADIIVFPELALTGYPPEDLLYRRAFHKQVGRALDTLCKYSHDIDVIIGYPHYNSNRIYNSCSLLRSGKILQTYHKQCLPNYYNQ